MNIIVIGAGIAGISAAAALARRHKVIVLETEGAAGFHSTGRSAAALGRSYGNRVVRELTAQSAPFLVEPPEGFAQAPLVIDRPWVVIGRADQSGSMRAMQEAVPALEPLSLAELSRRVPLLRPGYAAEALIDLSGCGDIDVDALLQGYARLLRARGGEILLKAGAKRIERRPSGWQVTTAQGQIDADLIVNAAGAWADEVAELAGIAPLGLVPMRRTAVTVDPPAGVDPSILPLVLDADEEFYFKPEAGRIFVSPADETPSDPCDAQPEELDVAIAIDRLEKATGLEVRRVTHRWAGLRTFAPDRTPVCGPDMSDPSFFWLAGQGGYGVQTAPAMADYAAALVDGRDTACSELAAALSPRRLAALV